ncbi:MAG: DedA family protein, partial [Candidatus Pacebacteria bacterium]|nr:DedA family protein [Candidatus Paceibacterota bacterium]
MSEKILALLFEFITNVISAGGYAGIVALMGIESACIPLP